MYDGHKTIGKLERVLYKRTLRSMSECPTSAIMPEAVFVTAEANGAALIYQDFTGERTCLAMTFEGHCKLIEHAVSQTPEYIRQWVIRVERELQT